MIKNMGKVLFICGLVLVIICGFIIEGCYKLYKYTIKKIQEYKILQPHNSSNKDIDVSIVEHSNYNGNKKYEVYINSRPTNIIWKLKKSAEFFYDHVINVTPQSIIIGNNTLTYYKVKFDICTLYIYDYVRDSNFDDNILLYLCNRLHIPYQYCYNIQYEIFNDCSLKKKCLEAIKYYNNTQWDKKIIKSSTKKSNDDIEFKYTHKDIKALHKIVKDYSDSVDESKKIASTLWDNINS